MGRHRLITTAVLTALALCVALPGEAGASSTLLSGYGGPGEGNQAIIGATLIGGSGGQGSSGGGSESGGASTGARSEGANAPSSGSSSRSTRSGGRARATGRAGQASGSSPRSYTPATAAASSRAAGSSALGLSGTDGLYMILAFGALALTAVITGRLARRADGTEQEMQPLKGSDAGPE